MAKTRNKAELNIKLNVKENIRLNKVISGIKNLESRLAAAAKKGQDFGQSIKVKGMTSQLTTVSKSVSSFLKKVSQADKLPPLKLLKEIPKLERSFESLQYDVEKFKKRIDAISGTSISVKAGDQIKGELDNIVGEAGNQLANLSGEEGEFDILSMLPSGGLLGTIGSGIGMAAGGPPGAAVGSAIGGTIGAIGQAFGQATKAAIGFVRKGLNAVRTSFQKTLKHFDSFRNVVNKTVDSFRQMTQGILSIGRAVTFFVSVPLTAFLRGAIKASLDLEDQLARIAKVAGGSLQNTLTKTGNLLESSFTDRLLELSLVTLSSITELSAWAEQLGQMGVKDAQSILNLLPIFDMVAAATDITADQIASSFGKIAAAFGKSFRKSPKEATEFVWAMANVVNILENNVGATAGQIVEALQTVGPMVSSLAIPPHVVATWAALGVEVGLSASEVGTSLKRTFQYFAEGAQNLEKYAIANQAVTEAQAAAKEGAFGYGDALTAVVVKYAQMKEAGDDAWITEMGDLFQRSGQKIVQALVEQIAVAGDTADSYEELLARTKEAMEDIEAANSSLVKEYDLMYNTASGAMKRLSNAFNYIKTSVGGAFLPAISSAVDSLIPIIRALTLEFTNLSDDTKKWIVYGVAALSVLGPLSFFFSQVLFGVSLFTLGLVKLVGVVARAGGAILAFGKSLLLLNPMSWLVMITLLRVFSGIRDGAFGTARDIWDIMKELITQASGWGKKLFGSYADGIRDSAHLVVDAVKSIVDIIAQFIRSFSPPKRGQLKHIDKWGKNLFDTYLEGMRDADFDILNDVGSTIEHILGTFEFLGDIEETDVSRLMMDYRERLAKMLAEFNETGQIKESSIQSVVAGLNEETDEVANLIRQYLMLKRIMLDIEALNEKRDDIMSAFNRGVRDIATAEQGNMRDRFTALERLQKQRDNQLFHTEEELEIEEKKKALQEEELARIKEMTDAQIDQDNYEMGMFEELSKKIGGLSDSISEALSKDFSGGFSGFGNVFQKKLVELRIKVMKFRTFVVGTFWSIAEGLTGWDLSKKLAEGLSPEAVEANLKTLRESVELNILPAGDAIKEAATTLGKDAGMELATALLEEGYISQEEIDALFDGDMLEGTVLAQAEELGGSIEEVFGGISDVFGEASDGATEFFDTLSEAFNGEEISVDEEDMNGLLKFAEFLGTLGALFEEHGPAIKDNLTEILNTLAGILGEEGGDAWESAANIVEALLLAIEAVTGNMADEGKTAQNIMEWLTDMIIAAIEAIDWAPIMGKLAFALAVAISTMLENIRQSIIAILWAAFKSMIQIALEKVAAYLSGGRFTYSPMTGSVVWTPFSGDEDTNQTGGPINGPSIVGESGPELFVPNTSGTIYAHTRLTSALASMGAGMGDNKPNWNLTVENHEKELDEYALERVIRRQEMLYG